MVTNFTFKSQNCTKSSITPVLWIVASKFLLLVGVFCGRGFQFCYQNFIGTLPWQQNFEYQRHNCTKSNITLAQCTVGSKFVLLWWDYRGWGFQSCYHNFQGRLPWQRKFRSERQNCTNSTMTQINIARF